jgi:hypothetical protein
MNKCIICNQKLAYDPLIIRCLNYSGGITGHDVTIWPTFVSSDEPNSYRIIFYRPINKIEKWSFTRESTQVMADGNLVFNSQDHVPYQQSYDFIKRVKKLGAFL